MKLTKHQLKQLIKEELQKVLREQSRGGRASDGSIAPPNRGTWRSPITTGGGTKAGVEFQRAMATELEGLGGPAPGMQPVHKEWFKNLSSKTVDALLQLYGEAECIKVEGKCFTSDCEEYPDPENMAKYSGNCQKLVCELYARANTTTLQATRYGLQAYRPSSMDPEAMATPRCLQIMGREWFGAKTKKRKRP